MTLNRDAEYKIRLDQVMSKLVGRRLTRFEIDWQVGLRFTDPGADQSVIIETPFTIGLPGDEDLVVPGEYGASIAKVMALLGEKVTSVVTEPEIVHLRLSFSSGSCLAVVGDGWPEWEYWASQEQDGGPWMVTR